MRIYFKPQKTLYLISIYYKMGLLQFPENAGKYWQRMFILG